MTVIHIQANARSPFWRPRLERLSEQIGIEIRDVEPGQSAEEPDLLLLPEVEAIARIREGGLLPLGRLAFEDRFDLDHIPQAAIDRFRAGDVIYAAPLLIEANVLLIRREWLTRSAKAVPTTFTGLANAAADAGLGLAGVAGFDENLRLLGETLFPAWGWRWHRGADLPPRIDEPAVLDALTWFAGMATERTGTISRRAARAQLDAGDVTFLIDSVPVWECGKMAPADQHDAEIELAMVPVGPSGRPEPGLFATAVAIPTTCREPDAAWKVVRCLIEGDDEAMTVDPVIERTLAYARINRPMRPGAVALGEIIAAAAEAVVLGVQEPAAALQVAQAMIDELSWRT